MIKIEKTKIFNLEGAIRGARNAKNSWEHSDSYYNGEEYILGENDLNLARKLCDAGRKLSSDHRKFIRQIMVCVDVTAPLYWWKEYDTYKVATTANSQSTMHKIHAKPIIIEDFSAEDVSKEGKAVFLEYIGYIENLRKKFVESKDKSVWRELIQLLPSSYNQLRTLTLNYENLANMFNTRRNHKLQEWRTFCKWIQELPYAVPLITEG